MDSFDLFHSPARKFAETADDFVVSYDKAEETRVGADTQSVLNEQLATGKDYEGHINGDDKDFCDHQYHGIGQHVHVK